jgi:hypothetical protein
MRKYVLRNECWKALYPRYRSDIAVDWMEVNYPYCFTDLPLSYRTLQKQEVAVVIGAGKVVLSIEAF